MRSSKYLAISQAAALLALVACDQRQDQTANPAPNGGNNSGTNNSNADNTGRNRRDADTNAKTPMDQKENSTDIKITADIRKAILDGEMSMNADNCKIITADGVVTLRGPVENQAEKDAIEAKAKAVAGVTRVQNELEIKAP